MNQRLTVLAAFFPAAFGCHHDAPGSPPPAATAATVAATTSPTVAPAHPVPAPTAAAPEADVRAAAQSTNAFGIELFRSLHGNPGNVAVSPASVAVALAMADAGARGPTAAQIEHVEHLDANGLDAARGRNAVGAMVRAWNTAGHGVTLRAANAVWAEQSTPLDRTYIDSTHSVFGAEARALDFVHNADAARTTINAWVDAQTEHKIPQLLGSSDVDATTQAVLTNAVYFRGAWESAFDPRMTRQGAFALSPRENVNVSLMSRTGSYRYATDNRVAVVELPYQGGSTVMDVILPTARDGLAAIETALTPEQFASWISSLAPVDSVSVTLPRFHANAASLLRENLRAMGMPLAFSSSADFTAMSAHGGLQVSNVVHQVTVDVDEQGTVAAAATAVTMTHASLPRLTEFTADHPFLYAIRDTQSGALLFLGRVTDPRG